MDEAKAKLWATDCPLAAIQFEQHAGVKPLHPMSILARAYRGDSFDPKVAPKPDDGKRRLPILPPDAPAPATSAKKDPS
jgi:glycerol-3-phosphate dehydrogenase subunit C